MRRKGTSAFHPAGLGKSMGHETHTKNHEKTWLGTSTHEAELNMVRCRVRRDKAYGSEQQRGKAGKFSVCPYGVVSRGRSRRWRCHTQSATDSIRRRARMESQRVGRGRRPRRPATAIKRNRVVGRLRAAEDVRPYRGRVSRVFGAKT